MFLFTERSELSRYLKTSAALAIAGFGAALIPALPRLTGYSLEDYDGVGRVLTWGLPAGGIVLGAVVAERAGLAVKSHAVLMLGAASYAIYLLHPIAVGQLLQLRPNLPPTSWALCSLATIVIVALSIGFHVVVERPILHKLRRLLGDRVRTGQLVRRGDDARSFR